MSIAQNISTTHSHNNNSLLSKNDKPGTSDPTGLFAKQLSQTNSKADGIKADFRSWKSDYFTKGISQDRRQSVQKYSTSFEKLIDKAVSQKAYDNPKRFLQSLSGQELKTLQHMHSLAAPINPANLSEEGALNLLLSPGHAKDIDNDGFQMVGLAKTWTFPPVNAPDSVKQAWDKTTANMSESDIMKLQGSFLPFIKVDGSDSKIAFIKPDADYSAIIQKVLDGAEFSKNYDNTSEQRENRAKQITALKLLLSNLEPTKKSPLA